MMRLVPIPALLLLLPCTAFGAGSEERVLVPIVVNAAGDRGSTWRSDLWAFNGDTVVHTVDANQICTFECPPPEILPMSAVGIGAIRQPANNPGLLMYVQDPADLITFHLRVQDTSRAGETWGTEIPVIREHNAFTRPVRLLNVPIDAQFRVMLRIYDFDGRPDVVVRVRAFDLIRGTSMGVLGSIDVPLVPSLPNINTAARYKPGYAELSALVVAFPRITSYQRIGLEIVPLTAGLRYWAFVSVTHNDTQHVTTITAQ